MSAGLGEAGARELLPPSAYWVESKSFLAGEHPGIWYVDSLSARIKMFLQHGISCFVDLTEEDEIESYETVLMEHRALAGGVPSYQRRAIPDMSVPSREHMIETLDAIDAMLSARRGVYLHCRAGLGRTGVVVGCYLVRHGLSGTQALRRIADLRQGRPGASPQTEEQCRFVQSWKPGW